LIGVRNSDKAVALGNKLLDGKFDSSVSVTGFKFGSSKDKVNTLLSRCQFDVSSKIQALVPRIAEFKEKLKAKLNSMSVTVISRLQMPPAENSGLSNHLAIDGPMGVKVELKKVDAKFDQGSVMRSGVTVGLTLPFNVDINLPHVGLSLDLDDVNLLDVSFGLVTKGSSQDITLNSLLKLQSTPEAQKAVAVFANTILTDVNHLTQSFVASKMSVGYSPDSSISFEKMALKLPAAAFITQDLINALKKKASETGSSSPSVRPSVVVDVKDKDTLMATISGKLTAPFVLNLDIPYMFAAVDFNGKAFAQNTIEQISIKDNILSTKVSIFMPDDPALAQEVTTLLGDVIFKRHVPGKNYVTLKGLGIGNSQADHVAMFAYLQFNVDLEPLLVPKATESSSKGLMESMQTSIQHEGYHVAAKLPDVGLDLKLNADVKSTAKWVNVKTPEKPYLSVMEIHDVVVDLPTVELSMMPAVDSVEYMVQNTVPGLGDAALKMLTWQSYGQGARAGYLTLVNKQTKVEFRKFSDVSLKGPEPGSPGQLIFPQGDDRKIGVDLYQFPEYDYKDPNDVYNLKGYLLTISFANQGPMHVNNGELVLWNGNCEIMNTHGGDGDTCDWTLVNGTAAETPTDLTFAKMHYFAPGGKIGEMTIKGINDGPEYGVLNPKPVQLRFVLQVLEAVLVDATTKEITWSSVFNPDVDPAADTSRKTITKTMRNGKYVSWFGHIVDAFQSYNVIGKMSARVNANAFKAHSIYQFHKDVIMTSATVP
jgi:hypothetical protein